MELNHLAKNLEELINIGTDTKTGRSPEETKIIKENYRELISGHNLVKYEDGKMRYFVSKIDTAYYLVISHYTGKVQ